MFEPKTYQYDRFSRFCRMATDNNLLCEKMDANLNTYVRDRLGSTVEVVDAKTDQLHIGNRWIGHKGLDLYDNTARMHNQLLARFHTVDPLWSDYPSQSPWSHCAANPLNFIDPTGCASIIYDGKVIGNDGKDDGRFLLLPTNKKEYKEYFNDKPQTLPAFSHGKDVTNKIVKFIKKNKGKTDAFNNATFENKNIYEYFFELESNPENISQMNNEVCKDTNNRTDNLKDSNNREYGGYFSNGKIIIEKPGEVANPSQGGASILLDQRKSSFHTHPSAIIDDGPTKSAYWQYPSITDITNKKHNGVNYVIGRRVNMIFFYNNQGILDKMKYTNFLKLFNKK